MSCFDVSQKFKGLINRKDWEKGSLKFFNDGVVAICSNGCHTYVFKESVSRFTGFTNSSGEEIYDGDLLALEGEKETETGRVFWDNRCQQWKLGLSPFQDSPFNPSLQKYLDCLVIGHTFTHQHLLKPLKITMCNE